MWNYVAASPVAQANLESVCGEDPRVACTWVLEQTESQSWAKAVDSFIELPLRLLLLVFTGFIVSKIFRWVVGKVGGRLAQTGRKQMLQWRRKLDIAETKRDARAEQRANTVLSFMTSLGVIGIWFIIFLLLLKELDINLELLIPSAGIVGIVLGFGAQTIVADFLSGLFMLIEDQFGVDDVIDVGEVSGRVEKVSLRITTLRDVNGTVWHVPNSEIRRIANKSQLWSRAVLDIEVAYDTDLRRAEGIIQRVADNLWNDKAFTAGSIIEPPEVWGVETLGADGVSIRLVVKTHPADQWIIARELRLRIKEALEEAQIEIPYPQRTVWLRQDSSTVPRSSRPKVPIKAPRHSFEEIINNPGG